MIDVLRQLYTHEAGHSALEDKFEEVIHDISQKKKENEYMRKKLRDIENRIKRANLTLINIKGQKEENEVVKG